MGKHPDYILFGVILALIILGISVLANVSAPFSLEKFDNSYYFLKHQLLFGLLPGVILAFLLYQIPLKLLKKWAPLLLLINLVALALVFLPGIGFGVQGATRWISLGPFSFQPSEFLKPTFILYLAAWLSSRTATEKPNGKKNKVMENHNQVFLIFLVITGVISLFLVLQPDISTLGIIVLVGSLMFFLSQTPVWQSLLIVFIGVLSLIVLVKIAPYRTDRFLVFFHPEIDPMGKGYQIKQALIAIGSGGISGVGMGMSQMKFGFLPQSITDSIFAIFAEENGFIGNCILILLFLLFLWRGIRVGKLSHDKFSQLAAWGITIWISLQSFINIGATSGVLPVSGIPLPFISYGGSSLVSELAGVGILLNISKQ